MRRAGDAVGRRYGNRQQLKQLGLGLKGLIGRLSVAVIVLLICTLSLFSTIKGNNRSAKTLLISLDQLWGTAASGGWRPSSAPRFDWPSPTVETNGYLRVRCNGGLNQQRSAICNAVLAARIMNATLVLPELDANPFWHDDSGFRGIYDVEHFIKSLRYDVRIVEKLPEIHRNGKPKKLKAYQLRPPRDAPIGWYKTVALEKMMEHGAIYLTPFSHRLAEEIDYPEYQRLRCRVNYHALRFKPHIMKLSKSIVTKLRARGHFMAIHLRFEMDMLAFAGCLDIFTPEEQSILKKYRKENFAEKELVYSERRAIGKCPLTLEEERAHEYYNGMTKEQFKKMQDFIAGQSSLLKSSILVIGAGGLGSPALLYLAACGIGRLGIVDHDIMELNNMHRQIIHTEAYIGQSKVESAAAACHSINSTIQIVEHKEAFRTSNALEILSKYDIVIDATDNVPSRYMINDCCVVLGKPLVSGAALGLEGQLTVYNYDGGPCYRCLFPTPPPTTACQRCSDSGVLGVVPGVIGCLQALEAIKVASTVGEPLSGRMLLFDALSARIRIVKIRGRSLQCEVCGEQAAFDQQQFRDFDYEKFTQSPLSTSPLKLNLLPEDARISSKEYNERVVHGEAHILVDVRPAHHFKIVSLPKSMNIPLSSLEGRLAEISMALKKEEEHKGLVDDTTGSKTSLYVVCRRGNDSQRAVQYLHKMGFNSAKDIIGGLESWGHDVDPNFPTY